MDEAEQNDDGAGSESIGIGGVLKQDQRIENVNAELGPGLRKGEAELKVEIDEEMLGAVADATGGQSFRATDTDSLEEIYDSINQLEKTTRKLKKYQQYEELYLWFLAPGLGMLLVELILRQTRFRRLP